MKCPERSSLYYKSYIVHIGLNRCRHPVTPAIKCPACAYETPDEDVAIVAALLQIHLSTAHPPASSQAAQTRGPKLSRPHIDAGVDQETWNTFVRMWHTFKTGSQINDAAASTQLFQCASEALGDTYLT